MDKRLIIIDKLGIIYDNSFFEEHIKYVNYYIEKNKINNYFKLDVGFQKARILSSLGYVVILGTGDNYLIYFGDSISLIQAKEFIKVLGSLKDKNIFYTLYKNNFLMKYMMIVNQFILLVMIGLKKLKILYIIFILVLRVVYIKELEIVY